MNPLAGPRGPIGPRCSHFSKKKNIILLFNSDIAFEFIRKHLILYQNYEKNNNTTTDNRILSLFLIY